MNKNLQSLPEHPGTQYNMVKSLFAEMTCSHYNLDLLLQTRAAIVFYDVVSIFFRFLMCIRFFCPFLGSRVHTFCYYRAFSRLFL